MEKLKDLWAEFNEVLTYQIYDSENIHITVGTFLTIVIGVVAVTYLLRIIHNIVIKKLPEADKNKFVSIFSFLKYLSYILVIIIILHSSGVNLTVLLTASAALFVGLGFALQNLFQDIISGVLMILDQSIHVGDIIEVEGKVGKVFEIRLRSTRAITRDDKVLIIPNHIFLTNTIYNYTQNHNITREALNIGVAYGSDVNLVTNILTEIAEEQKGVLKNPEPFVQFDDFGDSALIFSLNFFVSDAFRVPRMRSEMRYKIDARFRENGVTIPFPQRDVHFYQHSPIALKKQ
ncbi:Mechanosensitive ion channel [Muriicola jejuensis]|uniref:Mechanosensitive ion channel n=1 Tax=Muriicola jejuensis TaxID=504488 RepID=A0A6P0UBN7_9FLAO|nr:mechanosensitive ion channel domain-containing protein [Muriicola jejuensis]NER10701.1 mechanosensitive ion channel [Muriicola jejuensis]SMP16776.1 Mechanosensitive ion channel [Muriicola jejuensis]